MKKKIIGFAKNVKQITNKPATYKVCNKKDVEFARHVTIDKFCTFCNQNFQTSLAIFKHINTNKHFKNLYLATKDKF